MSNIKGIIFDVDGLMFDTESLGIEACKYAMPIMGLNISDHALISAIGLPREEIQRILFEDVGYEFDYIQFRKLRLKYIDDYVSKYGFPIKKGLYELLDYIDSIGLKKGVATSNYRELISGYLKTANILDRFDAITAMEEEPRGKPFPDLHLNVSRKLGVLPAECMVLEDSFAGIKAAHAARNAPGYDTRC